jgi:hypothetical protein
MDAEFISAAGYLSTELGIELCKPCMSDMQIPRPHSADMI